MWRLDMRQSWQECCDEQRCLALWFFSSASCLKHPLGMFPRIPTSKDIAFSKSKCRHGVYHSSRGSGAPKRKKQKQKTPVALCLRRHRSVVKGCCKKFYFLVRFLSQIVCHLFCFSLSFIVVVMVSPRHESLNQAKPYLARFKCKEWGCFMEVKTSFLHQANGKKKIPQYRWGRGFSAHSCNNIKSICYKTNIRYQIH